jgi:putative sugar O-methyltransferase
MKVQIEDGQRYMLDDDSSMDKFNASAKAEKNRIASETAAHDKWFAEAKAASPHDDRDIIILGDARRHMMAARSWPPPVSDGSSIYDSRWSAWAKSYYEEALKFTTCRDVLHFAQQSIPFDHRIRIEEHKEEFQIYEKLLTEEFPFLMDTQFNLYDNAKSIPETLYRNYGRLTSNVFYWHLRIMFRCQEDVPNLNSILEVGGGYGSLARLWMLNKIKRYVIVDLPESLFYSEVCLRAEFGDNVGYWEGSDPGTPIVLVPVGRISEYTQKSDLVINVGSLQEMSDAWVSFYMDWLDRYQPRFFYSLNYMGQSVVHLYESRNFWAPRPSEKWATRLLSPDVPLVKIMCSGRDFVEILYERAKPVQKFAAWSVLKGCLFNRATYLEGLELLRQDMTTANAMTFLAIVTAANDNKRLMCPKEILFIASAVHAQTKDPKLKVLVDRLSDAQKIGTH